MNYLREAGKALGGGFCGCVGIWVASLLMIIPLVLMAKVMVVPVLGDLGQEVIGGLREEVLDILGPFKQIREGPFKGPPAGAPTCDGLSLETVSIWLTKERDAEAKRFTVFTPSDEMYAWVQGPEDCEGEFMLRATVAEGEEAGDSLPMGRGGAYYFDSSGAPVAGGNLNAAHAAWYPSIRIDVIVPGGEAVAGASVRVEAVE